MRSRGDQDVAAIVRMRLRRPQLHVTSRPLTALVSASCIAQCTSARHRRKFDHPVVCASQLSTIRLQSPTPSTIVRLPIFLIQIALIRQDKSPIAHPRPSLESRQQPPCCREWEFVLAALCRAAGHCNLHYQLQRLHDSANLAHHFYELPARSLSHDSAGVHRDYPLPLLHLNQKAKTFKPT